MKPKDIQNLAQLIADYGYWSREVYNFSSQFSDGVGFDEVMKAHAKAKIIANGLGRYKTL